MLLDLLYGLLQTRQIERLQQIVDRIHLERAHGILVEGRRKDDLRKARLLVFFQQFFDDGKAVQPGICTSRKTISGLWVRMS